MEAILSAICTRSIHKGVLPAWIVFKQRTFNVTALFYGLARYYRSSDSEIIEELIPTHYKYLKFLYNSYSENSVEMKNNSKQEVPRI